MRMAGGKGFSRPARDWAGRYVLPQLCPNPAAMATIAFPREPEGARGRDDAGARLGYNAPATGTAGMDG